MERETDADKLKFEQLIDAFNLRQFVTDPTHVLGGLLDVIIASDKVAPLDARVTESVLSGHMLVHWTIPLVQTCPEYLEVRRRNWKAFDQNRFIECLESSSLCRPLDPRLSPSELADHYQEVITIILDELAPMTEMHVRVRPHRLFYDTECRQARRTARRQERAYRGKMGTEQEQEARVAWRTALQTSRRLVRSKARQYWRKKLESVKMDSRETWRHLDMVFGSRGKTMAATASQGFSANDYHDFLDNKINGIRERTRNAGGIWTASEVRLHQVLSAYAR